MQKFSMIGRFIGGMGDKIYSLYKSLWLRKVPIKHENTTSLSLSLCVCVCVCDESNLLS